MKRRKLSLLFNRIIKLLDWDRDLSFSIYLDKKEIRIYTNSIFCTTQMFDLIEFCKRYDLSLVVSTSYAHRYGNCVPYIIIYPNPLLENEK